LSLILEKKIILYICNEETIVFWVFDRVLKIPEMQRKILSSEIIEIKFSNFH